MLAYRELLVGSGSSRKKRMQLDWPHWRNVTTLDWNATHRPDVVHDLEVFPYPFEDSAFDEIHAYEVLEHTGAQGDFRFFFRQWEEFWRILKPGGRFAATVPSWRSMWAWGDPSHKRVITEGTLVFLDQREYAEQVGKTSMSDFRFCYAADFERLHVKDDGEQLRFVLRARKPAI